MRGRVSRRYFISIHAPHARSDADHLADSDRYGISIHAPHARSDDDEWAAVMILCEFQSTLLMRGATTVLIQQIKDNIFQSTLLMRGAT